MYSAAVCPYVVSFSKLHEPPDAHNILVASSSDTPDPPDFLVTCRRHPRDTCYTRMLRENCSRRSSVWSSVK